MFTMPSLRARTLRIPHNGGNFVTDAVEPRVFRHLYSLARLNKDAKRLCSRQKNNGARLGFSIVTGQCV